VQEQVRRLGSVAHRERQPAQGIPFAPAIVLLGLFLVVPIAMALWVSFSDWNGNGSPFGANAHYVGLANYRHLLTEPGLDQNNFGTAIRNNVYYVLLVVPIQTAVALFLAVLVNRRLRGVGFFRTAFYFPSVTSSVAISVVFLFICGFFGAVHSPWVVVTPLICAVLALSVAAPISAFSAGLENDSYFSLLFRFVVIPSTLFAGVFFPVTQLPPFFQVLAYASPLWHAVVLCRAAMLGGATPWPVWIHVGYMLLLAVVGLWWANKAYSKRLED
jgi:ABC-type sugar transport system permease subunit